MMKIKDILYVSTALLLLACTNEEKFSSETLSGGEKTPLLIEATLSTGNATTRAEGKDFASGDKLIVYLRHTKSGSKGSYVTTEADQAPKLVTFTKGSVAMEAESADINKTFDLTVVVDPETPGTPIYWDDFSNSASADTDLRTSGHGLQSYYGYCYNGGATGDGTSSTLPNGNITSALDSENGTLTWKVGTPSAGVVDQNSADAILHADLLWSEEQETVEYSHSTTHGGDHNTLIIPYTHAMSEITVTVTCTGDGFTESPLSSTSLTLNKMNTVATLTAPSATFSTPEGHTTSSITMFKGSYTSGLTRDFTAIVAPGTELLQGEKLLDITGVEDNNYTLTITSDMLIEATWAKYHDSSNGECGENAGKKFVKTQPGVNYKLDVTIKKTEVQTKATLADWTPVNATGEGDIVYNDDANDPIMEDDKVPSAQSQLHVNVVDENTFVNGASFTLFRLKKDDNNYGEGKGSNTRPNFDDASYTGYSFATVSTFTNDPSAADAWTNSPKLYWSNNTDQYYFRALAKFKSAEAVTPSVPENHPGKINDIEKVISEGSAYTTTTVNVSQGTGADHDILWGTTAKHKGSASGTTYDRGAPIKPRTGDVPMAFEHVMSKVTFQLKTTDDEKAKVDISKYSIAISNLFQNGTIWLDNGTVSVSGTITGADAITGSNVAPISDLIVVPQTIGDNSIVTINLKDESGNVVATYSLQLNKCVVDGSSSAITSWDKGKHYTYTINLEKEKVSFRALVKDWDKVTGSGNATLEWD